MRLMDIMIMRATQKKRMSRPVSSSAPGKKRCRSSPPVGQPKTEKGKRPLENQVSSTSSSCKGAQQSIPGSTSWISCGFWTLHCTHAAGVWTAPWVLHAMLAPPYLNACAVVSVSRIPHAGAQGLPAAMLQRATDAARTCLSDSWRPGNRPSACACAAASSFATTHLQQSSYSSRSMQEAVPG